MRKGILFRIGNSEGVVIPVALRRRLGWWQGDALTMEERDGQLIIENITQKGVRPIHTRSSYGDQQSRGLKRPI